MDEERKEDANIKDIIFVIEEINESFRLGE